MDLFFTTEPGLEGEEAIEVRLLTEPLLNTASRGTSET